MSKQEQQMALDLRDDVQEAVYKARKAYQENSSISSSSFWINKSFITKKLYYAMRTFDYEVDWEYFFPVTKEQAREIVQLGYAKWWSSIKEDEK